jgi:hypothetical protein
MHKAEHLLLPFKKKPYLSNCTRAIKRGYTTTVKFKTYSHFQNCRNLTPRMGFHVKLNTIEIQYNAQMTIQLMVTWCRKTTSVKYK